MELNLATTEEIIQELVNRKPSAMFISFMLPTNQNDAAYLPGHHVAHGNMFTCKGLLQFMSNNIDDVLRKQLEADGGMQSGPPKAPPRPQ